MIEAKFQVSTAEWKSVLKTHHNILFYPIELLCENGQLNSCSL